MKSLRYFFEYIIIKFLFFIFSLLGYSRASNIGEKIGKLFGPLIRDNKKILHNLEECNIGNNDHDRTVIVSEMWGNYGRILAEYPFIKHFRNSNLSKYITLEGKDILDEIIREKKSVVFISAHFNNFELMALCLEKAGIDLAAIYRPLNNFFLNNTMEKIRKKYICRNQIKKGKSGSREILKFIKQNFSIALMIDQRVSEGVKSNFFNRLALTTSIPAQIIKKYDLEIVPVYIERKNKIYFNMSIDKPIKFNNKSEIIDITNRLNNVIEKRILSNPSQWIWTHNRWK